MSNFGIKVAVDGKDAMTALDKDLSLKTNFKLLKVFKSGSVDMTVGTGSYQAIFHGLGYVPQFLVYVANEGFSPPETFLGTGNANYAVVKSDTQNVNVFNLGSQPKIYYYIFDEQAEL